MKIIILNLILGLTLLCVGSSYSLDKTHLKTLGIQEIRQEAPDFIIKGSDGNMMSLKDFRGKVIILHFWATWCKPCKEELPAFEKLYQGLKGKDAAFLPISVYAKANKDEVDAFAIGLGASFPVFLARDGNVTDKYWTWGVPVTYLIDKKGWIIGRATGPRDWTSSDVKDFIDSLLKDQKN